MNHLVHNASMARPLEFDRSKAVKKALVLFWRQGYHATSLADLLATMGISRSSFYAAFGDKRSLFIECMDLFSVRNHDMLQRARAEMPPLDVLQSFFEGKLVNGRSAIAERRHWGCLQVNTVLEMAGVDDELAARASHNLSRLQHFFRVCLEDAGAEPARAEELAAMLMLFNEGIRVSSRRRLPDAQLQKSIATTFRLIQSAIA